MIMPARLRGRLNRTYLLGNSPVASWLRGAGWIFGSSLLERAIALMQTILIARAIGIEDYGRYALLFSTISLLSPIASLQLPYAIIYFVSRYAERDPAKAGAVVLLGERLTMVTTGLLLAACLLGPDRLSLWLLNEPGYGLTILFGGVILLGSVQAGLYDTILQARESFRILAIARTSSAILSVGLLAAAVILEGTLTAVMGALAGGAMVRLLSVLIPARRIARGLTAHTNFRQALGQSRVIFHFSLPSGMLALGMGYAVWIGNYCLSRNPAGLRDLAVMNTAIQWRTPILVVMASLASALLPMLGRMLGSNDPRQTRQLQTYNMILNLGLAIVFCAIVILGSDLVLGLYGKAFRGEGYLFGLFLITVVPTVFCNVHQQLLVATGRLWTQLLLFAPFCAVNTLGTLYYRDGLRGETLGYIQLTAWLITALLVAWIVRRHDAKTHSASVPPTVPDPEMGIPPA